MPVAYLIGERLASRRAGYALAAVALRQRMLIARYRAPAPLSIQPEAVSRWAAEHLGLRAASNAVLAER